MLLKFSSNLDKQEIWATGAELTGIMGKSKEGGNLLVHIFENPVLVTDNYRISKLNPTLRDTLFAILNSRPRIVEYDDVSVHWDDSHKRVWSPSIDTILLAKTLRKILPANPQIKSAIELGCGSGFISKYILAKSDSLKTMVINDISPFAIKCAKDNISDTRADFREGDGLKELEGKTFDLITCNPPYIPRPNSDASNPYEGIGILNYLVHNGQKHLNKGGIIVISMSNLSNDPVFNDPSELVIKNVEEMEVPLKINNILNNQEWMEYLQKHGLAKNYHDGYEYWHRIKTIACRK